MRGAHTAGPRAARVALGLAALILVPKCVGGAVLGPRIVNGTFTSAFPATVALLEGADPATATASCSGTLIGCRTVLTAAHCFCGQRVSASQCQPSTQPRVVFLQHAGFVGVEGVAVHPAYAWPLDDLAIVHLRDVVEGVAPAMLASVAPPVGTLGTVVGFGRSGAPREDYGLKRAGGVVLAPCTSPEFPDELLRGAALCFDFAGPPGSNTCNGDSGGPLLVDRGGAMVVAGVTSGGTRDDCLAGDRSWDTSVAQYRDWIAAQVPEPLDAVACGTGPQAGGPLTTVIGLVGELAAPALGVTHTIDVPAGTKRLRITMNAEETPAGADFDLLAEAGREPSAESAPCQGRQPNQYAACEIVAPPSGPWFVRVARVRGSGRYQVTATLFGVGPGLVPACGNGVREPGEICDGGDAAACPGGCGIDCACGPGRACAAGRIAIQRLRTRRVLRVVAVLRDPQGELRGFDPTRSAVGITVGDGARSLDAVIPVGDPGWRRSGRRRVWQWRGERGQLRSLRLRDRTERRGRWDLRIRGRSTGADVPLDRRRAQLSVVLGSRCLAQ